MENIFKFQVKRGVEKLSNNQINIIGLESHPSEIQSNWYRIIERLCKIKDYDKLIEAILKYLKGSTAIYSIEQLNPVAQKVFHWVSNKKKISTEADLKKIIELVTKKEINAYFKEKGISADKSKPRKKLKAESVDMPEIKQSAFERDYQSIADTSLALSIIGKLGHKDNLDYVLLLKTLQLIKLLFYSKRKFTLAQIWELLDKPVLIPSCFFKLNPCTKKLEPVEIDKPFNHLGIYSETYSLKENKNQNPDDRKCECDCDESCKGQNPCCAEIKPYITDLMVVREELKCYESGHLAYNETIMLGEERVREHRHLERTEDYSETEEIKSRLEEKDHLVSERFSLQTESQKIIEQDLSLDTGVTANTWGPSYDVSTSLDLALDSSKSESQRVAREKATDITERTLTRIQESIRKLTSKKRIIETEEVNTHTFKNTVAEGGVKHINGMYHFANMISKAQVMNYGKRLMLEFVLPEPLEMYKSLMSKEIAPFDLIKPNKPSLSPSDIAESNYQTYVQNYYLVGVKPISEPEFDYVSAALQQDFDPENKREGFIQSSVSVPTGYQAIQFTVSGNIDWGDGATSCGVAVGTHHSYIQNGSYSFPSKNLPNIQGSIPITFMAWGLNHASIIVNVKCKRKHHILEEWRLSIYEKILARYQEELDKYNTEFAKWKASKEAKMKFGRNPFINREIERTELKRMAISYISCQFYDQFSAMKRNVKPCGFPQMDLEQAQKEGAFIQFFEQLFEWNLMTYLFYPYFWGQKCSWSQKVQENSGDPLFDKALMAGAARVLVPVRSGHEPLAMHWITFGEIWQGSSQPPVPGSSYYVSMAQEIKEQKGVFYADREGELEVFNGQNEVILTSSAFYWDFVTNSVNQLKIDNDIDREIIIDCEIYRIISIVENTTDSTHNTWKITLERNYEEIDNANLKWSTGAVFVGAPFEVMVPTNLVYLRNQKNSSGQYVTSDCLPCYPLTKCDEI